MQLKVIVNVDQNITAALPRDNCPSAKNWGNSDEKKHTAFGLLAVTMNASRNRLLPGLLLSLFASAASNCTGPNNSRSPRYTRYAAPAHRMVESNQAAFAKT
jgi:hypothetical protein